MYTSKYAQEYNPCTLYTKHKHKHEYEHEHEHEHEQKMNKNVDINTNIKYQGLFIKGYYPKMRIQLLGDSYPSSLLSIYTR